MDNKIFLKIITRWKSPVTPLRIFLNYSWVKYKNDVRKTLAESTKQKKDKKAFLLNANYFIDELLLSGKVLFNDPISEYVTKLGEHLMEGKDLSDDIRFYTIKSNVTNAFSTNQGIIFVTTGLISQLENEAQLAFILAHEIAHYELKHTINSYLETQDITKGTNTYKRKSLDDRIKSYNKHSREVEFEADSMGIALFLKTDYDISNLISVFDVLLYSYLPFDEEPFDKAFFERSDYHFPDTFQLETVNPITAIEDRDDTYSTHPNAK